MEYLFGNPLDPAQLTGITRAGTTVELHYDGDGNLTNDEQGRTLTYNSLGQLERVDLPDGEYALYAYDPLDRLASQGASALAAPTEKEQATSSE
ncbi:RHS Repeat protein [compost metagenome]